eukprot:NODE_3922_length_873_cov_20.658177_g3767_i0.p2 GENE.NODE_3922_length_873_cov_20.658177_g3767_i0~~NODE_3922_length_873_cov_20.658177_g3767_i0.p2  ORF type:complete len:159 (+),score=42.81 NODE_3922_length_873_cov_20.658177_g3767_i0:380-856(+)
MVKLLTRSHLHLLPEQTMAVLFPTAEEACQFAQEDKLEIAGAQCPMIVGFSNKTEGCFRCMERGHSGRSCKNFYQRLAHFSTKSSNKMPVAERNEVEAAFGKVEDIFYCFGKRKVIRDLLFPTKALAEAAIAKQNVTLGGCPVQLMANSQLFAPKVAV